MAKNSKSLGGDQKHRRRNWRRVLVIVASALIVISVGSGFYLHYASQKRHQKLTPMQETAIADKQTADWVASERTHADSIFRKYLIKQLSAKNLFVSELYNDPSGQNLSSSLAGATAYDAANKKLISSLDTSCSTQSEDASATVKVTTQTENATSYIRLNSAEGTVQTADGRLVDAGAALAKQKGVWYQFPQADSVVQAELDAGVFVFNDGALAPGYDAQKVADTLLRSQAFEYTQRSKEGETYIVDLTTHKSQYVAAIKQAFPNLKKSDIMVDNQFAGESTVASVTLALREDGSLVYKQADRRDMCAGLISLYFGSTARPFSSLTESLNTPKKASDSKIMPVTAAQPFSNMVL